MRALKPQKKRGVESFCRNGGSGKPMHETKANDPRPLLDVSAHSHTLVHFENLPDFHYENKS
jgi:hypothetical protein